MKNLIYIAIDAWWVLSILTGCAVTNNYGQLKQSDEITHAFETYTVLPDHRYYYRGLFSQTYAIAGIHQTYELTDTLWKEVDFSATSLQQVMDRLFYRYGSEPYGSFILGPAGAKLGIWYSSLHSATIKMNANNQIFLLSPQAPYTGEGR